MDPLTLSAIIGGATSIFSGVMGRKAAKEQQPKFNPLKANAQLNTNAQGADNTWIVGISVFLLFLIFVIALIFIARRKK